MNLNVKIMIHCVLYFQNCWDKHSHLAVKPWNLFLRWNRNQRKHGSSFYRKICGTSKYPHDLQSATFTLYSHLGKMSKCGSPVTKNTKIQVTMEANKASVSLISCSAQKIWEKRKKICLMSRKRSVHRQSRVTNKMIMLL